MGEEGEKKNNDNQNYNDNRIKRKETALDASIAD